MPVCRVKHTAFQPSDEEWKCPQCGVGAENGCFYIDSDDYMDCDKLHTTDSCACLKCGYEGSGAVVARKLVKQLKLVTCPTCKGKGMIDGI